ncbi:unnamed protein product, partial [Rotaria magnacalcarata]
KMSLIIYVYDTSENRLFNQTVVSLFVAVIQFYHVFVVKRIQQSVFMFRQPNATNVGFNMYKDISFEDCRCHVISIESCLTNLQFKYTRILPLILFLLEIYIFKDLLSLYRYRRYFIVNFYWIVSIFLFFCLVIIIYRSSHYYIIINTLLSELGILLSLCCAVSKAIP